MDETTHFHNNQDFCVLLVKLIEYCKDPYIKETLEIAYHETYTLYGSMATTEFTMCSGLNQVGSMV